MTEIRTIYCCGCEADVSARLTSGQEIYPHRRDLYSLPFWKCDACGNFVGCHHKTGNPTQPLGVIPTPAIKEARKRIHAALDPVWKNGRMDRGNAYRAMAARLGIEEYHTGEIRTLEQADAAYRAAQAVAQTKAHKCDCCHRRFGSEEAVDQHMRIKHRSQWHAALQERRAAS